MLKALPTLFLVILLHFYIKRTFFRPLEKVLDQRRAATEGAREAAESSLRLASEKAAAYETAIRDARSEIYRENEESRKQWRQEQEAAVGDARSRAEQMVKQAKKEIADEVAASRQQLGLQSEALANEITGAMLSRRPS